jgi:Fur family zinc uptake transcriptional regulator
MNECTNHQICIDDALKTAEDICLSKAILFTPQRKSIFKLIWNSHKPMKAYDILSQFQKEDPDAKPITIYRSLDFLLENGIIHKIESQNTYLGCTHPTKEHNCYFTICDKCSSVTEECSGDYLDEINKNLKERNFKVNHVTLEIHGTCSKCS